MSDRSKTPTLRETPEGPKATVGPHVDVDDVPMLRTAQETPKSKSLPPRPAAPPVRDSMEDANTHVFDSGRFQKNHPPVSGTHDIPSSKPPINDTLVDPTSKRGPASKPPINDTLVDPSSKRDTRGAPASKPPINDTLVGDTRARSKPPIVEPLVDPEISETYSRIDPSELEPIPAPLQAVSMMPRPPKLPDDGTFKQEVATPVRAISMKTPGTGGRERAETPPRAIPQVKLRSMADVAQSGPVQNLGYLAPPRDHREVRSRRRGELVIWGSVCVMIACAVALGIWFLGK